MDIRETMVKERREILEKMDDATLARHIDAYFANNAAMPGEGWIKKDASQLAALVENSKDVPGFNMDSLYTEEKRKAVIEKFADVSIKDVRLRNAAVAEGRDANDMVFPEGRDLGNGKIRYVLNGEVLNNGDAPARVSFANGTMVADIPAPFLKNHPNLSGTITVEAMDYSNGKGKNVTYDMYIDMMQGSDFDRALNQEKFAPGMDGDIMSRICDKFEAYVPPLGNAPTVGGEMVRAMNRIGYRYLNDGDKMNDGYGRETVNPAARFLMEKGSDEVKNALTEMWAPYSGDYFSDDQYEAMLNALGEALIKQLDESPELLTTPNKEDMTDYSKPEDQDDTYDDEEEEFWEEDEDEDEYDDEDEEDYEDFTDAVDSLGEEDEMEL